MKRIISLTLLCGLLLTFTPGCDRNALTSSKLTLGNYDQVTNGMTKAQVERIMGPPTTMETKL
jgi:outer membrane protein assembly factor BamE (lipoprotein component of BamABCDE complex)